VAKPTRAESDLTSFQSLGPVTISTIVVALLAYMLGFSRAAILDG
jgi:hypothetical protein